MAPPRVPSWMLGASDILPRAEYLRVRSRFQSLMCEIRQHRRVRLTEDVVMLFENRETIVSQVHEVLMLEGYSRRKIEEELGRYQCLVPPPGELRATAMIDGGTRAEGTRWVAALRRPGVVRLHVDGVQFGSELADDEEVEVFEDDPVQFLRFRVEPGYGRRVRSAKQLALSIELDGRWLTAPVDTGLREQLAQDLDSGPPSPSLLPALARCGVVHGRG